MNFEVLANKSTTINNRTGESMMNLLDLTFVYPTTAYKYNTFTVTKEYICRPDLISLDKYGSEDYADIICKLNGISNPFELNEGMLIELPDITYMGMFVFDGDNIEKSISERDISIYKDTKAARSNNTNKTYINNNQSNTAALKDKNFTIDSTNGVIIY